MKSTVTAVLVALLFVSGIAFAQGMRVEKKKVVKDPEKVESTAELEEDVEIVLELEKPACPGCQESKDGPCEKCKAAKKTIQRRVFILDGEDGKGSTGGRGGHAVVVEGDDDLEKIIRELKMLRAQIKTAKSPEDLENLANDLGKARVHVEAGRKALDATRHVVVRRMAGAHGMPTPGRCGCGGCTPPKPAPHCPHCGPHHAGPMGPMNPMAGLQHSLDALRGEIAGLRHEMRAMRGVHAPKAPGAFHMSGTEGRSFGVAVQHPPVKKPAPPPKAVAVGKGGAGGMFIARSPIKSDPRQAKLEKEVQDLRKETAHMKQMMAEILKKLDGMQKDK